MSVTLSISGTVQATDSTTGVVALKKALASLTMTGTAFSAAQELEIGVTPVTISLPKSPTNFLYLKNLSSTETVTVTWTPLGGASASVQTLQPGGFIAFGQSTVGAGITALSVVASLALTKIEFLIGG